MLQPRWVGHVAILQPIWIWAMSQPVMEGNVAAREGGQCCSRGGWAMLQPVNEGNVAAQAGGPC
eukprot:10423064-Prorocentrum_lima.AAC.1